METSAALFVGIVTLLIASGFLSFLVGRQRLRRWAKTECLKILKQRGARALGSDWRAFGLISGWCFYVTVEDREKNVFAVWIEAGGILAAIRDAEIEVMWDNRPAYLRPD
jgi:hypothetical protein